MAARSALVGDVSQASGKTVDYIAGLNQAILGVAFLVGPAVAGVLLAALNSSLVLIITAACSFLAALLTTVLRLAKRELTEEEKQAAAADNALNLQALKSWGQVLSPAPIRMLGIFFLRHRHDDFRRRHCQNRHIASSLSVGRCHWG